MNSVAESYSYDLIYQLTQVLQGTTPTETYSYDNVGNRLSSLNLAPYAYNSSNQLTSTPSATYAYDYNGNTTSKTDTNGTTQFVWDFENRLTSVTLPGTGGTVTFKYDPFGRRIQKNGALGNMNYVYDGANIVGEYDSGGSLLAKYTQGSGVDQPLSMSRSGVTAYYSADGLGSVTSLEDGTGSAVAAYTYDAFGKLTSPEPALANPFRYTGREWDQETGLYYYRARYYDPSTGRFIGEDQIGFDGGPNFYRYAGGSPTNFVDPSGHNYVCPITRPSCRPDIMLHLSDCVKQILQSYFPGTNLDAIEIVPQLPAPAQIAPIDVGAITWDGVIYYQPGFFSSSASGIASIGHEIAHINQQNSGLWKFLGNYLGSWAANLVHGQNLVGAYEHIPAEIQANDMEQKIFADLLNHYGMKDPCNGFCK